MRTLHMKRLIAGAALPLAAVLLAGCGAPPPNDFGSNWSAVNRFHDTPQEVPLVPAYVYYASPMDGTLRGMLRRWADDNAMPLVWQLNSDYTLYKPVARLRATSLQAATNELNQIYANQGVSIMVDAERILVRASPPPAEQPASAAAPASPPKSAPERLPTDTDATAAKQRFSAVKNPALLRVQPNTDAAAAKQPSAADGVRAKPAAETLAAARLPNTASVRAAPAQSAAPSAPPAPEQSAAADTAPADTVAAAPAGPAD